jgi:hypothetical protein
MRVWKVTLGTRLPIMGNSFSAAMRKPWEELAPKLMIVHRTRCEVRRTIAACRACIQHQRVEIGAISPNYYER